MSHGYSYGKPQCTLYVHATVKTSINCEVSFVRLNNWHKQSGCFMQLLIHHKVKFPQSYAFYIILLEKPR